MKPRNSWLSLTNFFRHTGLMIAACIAALQPLTAGADAPETVWANELEVQGPADDGALSVATWNGFIYMAGYLHGDPNDDGGTFRGRGFVRKLDADGNELWTRTIHAPDIPIDDFFGVSVRQGGGTVHGVAADESGVYLTGTANQPLYGPWVSSRYAFVQHLDHDGNEIWLREIADATGNAIAVHDGDIYIAGQAFDNLTDGSIKFGVRPSALVAKYDASGDIQWMRQFQAQCVGLGDCLITEGRAIAVNDDAVVIGGTTRGPILQGGAAGWWDGFVIAMDRNGMELWRDQFGSPDNDFVHGIAADDTRFVVVGELSSQLEKSGCYSTTATSGILRTYSPDGIRLMEVVTPQAVEGVEYIDYRTGNPCPEPAWTSFTSVAAGSNGPVVGGWKEGGVTDGDSDGFVNTYDWTGALVATGAIEREGPHTGHEGGSARGGEPVYGIALDGARIYAAGAITGYSPDDKEQVGDRFGGDQDAITTALAADGTRIWNHQYGTLHAGLASREVDADDIRIANDQRGGTYVASHSNGVLPGVARTGPTHVHVAHYRANGDLDWAIQLGGDRMAKSSRIVDAASDRHGVTVLWQSGGVLRGYAVVTRISMSGEVLWERTLFGDYGGNVATALAGYDGKVYVFGSGKLLHESVERHATYVVSYDLNGNLANNLILDLDGYEAFFGTSLEVHSAVVDARGIHIAGWRRQTVQERTPVLEHYDIGGNLLASNTVDGASVSALDPTMKLVASDNAYYLLGATREIMDGDRVINGLRDYFVQQYDAGGTLEWTRQLGQSRVSFSANDQGVVLLTDVGRSGRDEGLSAADGNNVLRQLDTDGEVTWITQYGSSERNHYNIGAAISARSDRTIFVSGLQENGLDGEGYFYRVTARKLTID